MGLRKEQLASVVSRIVFDHFPVTPSPGSPALAGSPLLRRAQDRLSPPTGRGGILKIWMRQEARSQVRVRFRRLERQPHFPEWQPEAARRAIEQREFSFLNVTRKWSGTIRWSSSELDRLWAYHLNSFAFLNIDLSSPEERLGFLDLSRNPVSFTPCASPSCERGETRRGAWMGAVESRKILTQAQLLPAAIQLALEWRHENSTGNEVGWEPYPLSLRIVNWLKFLAHNAESGAREGHGRDLLEILSSLYSQACALENQLETDLMANHLLKNVKAMIFAGVLMDCADSARWRRKGETLLTQQLREQILPDGGHFERSPMYHIEVLEDLLDLKALSGASSEPLTCEKYLAEQTWRMAEFLGGILHPDGEIPLFNDSVFGVARSAGEMLRQAGAPRGSDRGTAVFPDTGYAVIRDRSGACLIFDAGPLGPDYQPGHGHCDALSYELTLSGKRVVVDTGVSTYTRSAERDYERSTCAHNTIRVDGEEQAEIWASFRAGRKPRLSAIETGTVEGCRFVRAEHFGYRRLGVVHCRTIFHLPERSWLVVDALRGTGEHRIESFIHFQPGIRLEPITIEARDANEPAPQGSWRIRFAGQVYELLLMSKGDAKLKRTWYAPQFGLRQQRSTIHWTAERSLPTRMIYAFVPAGREREALARINSLAGCMQ